MGDFPARRFHPQALVMLATSMVSARNLFPDAQLVVATNSLTDETQRLVEQLAYQVGGRVLECEPWLPADVSHESDDPGLNNRNCWWKFAPFRVDPDGHELVMDNDVVLWRVPRSVRRWLDRDDVWLGNGDLEPGDWTSGRQSYGTYLSWMREHFPNVSFSSGMMGWPPGFLPSDLPHPYSEAVLRPHFYSTEQGFLARNWLTYGGRRDIVSWSEVPAVNDFNRSRSVQEVMMKCDGAHFSDHNVGRSTRFTDEFLYPLRDLFPSFPGPAPSWPLRPVSLAVF